MHAAGPHIRTIEWKHMLPAHVAEQDRGTITTVELRMPQRIPTATSIRFPTTPTGSCTTVTVKWRLSVPTCSSAAGCGEYRYFDMDQAIGRALMWVRRILSSTMSEALGA